MGANAGVCSDFSTGFSFQKIFRERLFGGTVIIAIMVMAAFANVANAGGCSYSKSKSAEATTEEVKDTADKKAEVEA